MEKIVIKPENVCSREIEIEYEDGVIKSAKFLGGCNGNTQGIAALIVGRPIQEVVDKLSGIKCRGSRTGCTSCPDQLAIGLKSLLK